MWRSNHCSPRREEEGLGTNPSRTLRHIQVPIQGKTIHILAWHQQRHQTTGRSMRHISETSTSGAKAATEATPPPEQPWQQLEADFMTFDGSEYLVIVDYYSKMPVVWKMPTSQCNSARTITVLKELFAEHGIPKEI